MESRRDRWTLVTKQYGEGGRGAGGLAWGWDGSLLPEEAGLGGQASWLCDVQGAVAP